MDPIDRIKAGLYKLTHCAGCVCHMFLKCRTFHRDSETLFSWSYTQWRHEGRTLKFYFLYSPIIERNTVTFLRIEFICGILISVPNSYRWPLIYTLPIIK